MSKLPLFVLLVLLVSGLAACGGGSDEDSGGSTPGGGINTPVFSGPDANGVIRFESITPATWVELLDTGDSLPRTTVNGILYMPAGAAGPVPAMVVGHGSNGTGPKQVAWANDLNARGIAAFVIDNFGPRGISDGQSVVTAVETADALFALAVLRALPQIDNGRIGVMDFGGSMGIATGFDEVRRAVNLGGDGFSVHVALYPNCNIRQWSANVTQAPIWILHGELDDWNSAADCNSFATVLNNSGAMVTMKTYPGAYHGFDGPGSVSFKANLKSNRMCAGEFRLDTRVLRRYDDGTTFLTGQAYRSYLADCRINGATTGGNAMARAQALADVDSILRAVFGL